MKAAVMEAVRKPLVVKDVQDPSCPANGVIIRSEAEGVCRSDWHAWSGDWAWIGLAPGLRKCVCIMKPVLADTNDPIPSGYDWTRCGLCDRYGNG